MYKIVADLAIQQMNNEQNNEIEPNTPCFINNVSIIMFKIIGGKREYDFQLTAMSDQHAIIVAYDFYNRLGLFGRYYCETSTGKSFSVSS
jgi:hypothetical protein